MNYIAGSDRGEVLLLPEALEDYIAAENPVRFIDAFVGQLDLGKEGFRHGAVPETGRPPYDPGDLLRLYLYGYLNRVRSSRGLEREAARNLEVIWLLRKLRPDFKTIADFRRENAAGNQSGRRASSFSSAASWSYSGASWWRSTRPRSRDRTRRDATTARPRCRPCSCGGGEEDERLSGGAGGERRAGSREAGGSD